MMDLVVSMGQGRNIRWWLSVALTSVVLAGCGSGDPASVIATADAEIAAGKYGDANVMLKKLVQDFPDNPAARARLAAIAVSQGDYQAADEELSRVDRSALQDAVSQRARLDVDLGLGRYNEVLAALDDPALKIGPAQAMVLRGHAQRGIGQRAAAIDSYRHALAAAPDLSAAAVGIADVQLAEDDVAAATRTLTDFLARQPDDPDALVARGKIYGRKGEFANAAASFAKAVANAPPSWPPSRRWSAKYQQAEAHLRRNDIDGAKAVYEELNKAVPGIAATRLLAARIALLERRFHDGIEELQRLAQGAPDNESIALLLAQAQFAGGSREQAVTTLERLVARNARNLDAVKLLARVRLEQGRPDRALELIDAVSADHPLDPDLVSLGGAARLQMGRPKEAIASLERAIANDPTNQAAKLQLAAARLSQRNAEGALALLDELPDDVLATQQDRLRLLALISEGNRGAVDKEIAGLVGRDPVDPQALGGAIEVLMAAGRLDLARKVADRLYEVAADKPALLLRVAQVAAADKDWTRAETALNEAIKRDARNIDFRVALAQIAAARGDEERAIAVLDEARRIDPAALAPQLLRAAQYLRLDNPTEANKVIDDLLRAAPTDGAAAAAAGVLLMNFGKPEAALPRLTLATEQRPSAENWFNLSRAQFASGQKKAARDSLVRAVAAKPDWVAAVGSLASLDIADDKPEDAVRRSADFARRFPRSAEAQQMYGETLLAAKRPVEANKVFAAAFALAPSSALAVGQYRARSQARLAQPEEPLASWLARTPNDLAVRALLAEAYMRTNNRARAIAEYEDLLGRSGTNVLALNNLAWLYSSTNPGRAEELGRRALAIAPESSAVLDTLGWILFNRDKTSAALPMLAKAATGAAGDPAIQYHYARVLAKEGDAAKAKEVVQRALASKSAFEQRGDAERLLKDLSK